jgi:release factor glutamine methyltransferase
VSDYVTGQNLLKWYQQAVELAIACQVPVKEVHWLLREITGLDSLSLHLKSYQNLAAIPLTCSLADLTQLWQRRINERLPVQYIAGVAPWRNFTLKVTPSVLIPRPETELLIDLVAQILQKEPYIDQDYWVDLGTGSGAIALGLASILTKATIHAVDLSEAALEVAEENIKHYGLSKRINLLQGSWWTPLESLKDSVRAMVSNPPYIPRGLIEGLQAEVREHEPHLALDGGEDGLVAIRHLVETAPEYLCSDGIWLIEIMVNQSQSVVKLLLEQGCYKQIEVFKDLAGIERYVLARRC